MKPGAEGLSRLMREGMEKLCGDLDHLRFNAKSGSTYDRCLDDLLRFVVEPGGWA